MTSPEKGQKFWVWNLDSLQEVECQGVTEISGRVAILYPGYAAVEFFRTREEAIEYKLYTLCGYILQAKKDKILKYGTEHIVEMAHSLLGEAEKTRVRLTE